MLTKNLQPFFEARSSKLFYYSPYSFFRHIAVERIQDVYINELYQGIENNKTQIINFTIYGEEFYFLLEYLDWDSRYFNMKTYKLHTILFKSAKREYLCLAVKQFDEYLKKDRFNFNTQEKNVEISMNENDIIVLKYLNSFQAEGRGGYGYTHYITYDLKTGKEIVLNDIFKDNYESCFQYFLTFRLHGWKKLLKYFLVI